MPQVLLAEFADADACARAVQGLKEQGYEELEVYMPYPAKSVQEALALAPSPLPWWVLFAGLFGTGFAYFILWWTQHVDYPLNAGGHPTHSAPAFIGITFETAVLFAALTAFFGMLRLCRLPRLHHPLFELDAFERATLDRFFVVLPCVPDVELDPRLSLTGFGALSVVAVDA